MEDETNNSELLINTEPQATEQPKPTNPQPTTETNPEPNQEATETPKQEEKKMSEVDLSKMSLEELQAEIERRKQEEAKPNNFVPNENDPADLAKYIAFRMNDPMFAIGKHHAKRRGGWDLSGIIDYPGKLTKFCWMYNSKGNRINSRNSDDIDNIRIISVYEDTVVDEHVLSTADIERIIEKL
ncbi:MAG: hypothetical protein IJS15_12765 [Victivallales bacterium]|nr:hypothetical protein [Victivallales bacterium]